MRSSKYYEKLFGLSKPERTTEMSAQNAEIEENRKQLRPGYYRDFKFMTRKKFGGGWLTKRDIVEIIRRKIIENSKRKRGEKT